MPFKKKTFFSEVLNFYKIFKKFIALIFLTLSNKLDLKFFNSYINFLSSGTLKGES